MFENWKERCSSLGHLMTKEDKITERQTEKIKELVERKHGGGKALTSNMEIELSDLIAKRDAPDTLPSGVTTHLDDCFRSQFWGRRRLIENKYVMKGKINEEDSLDLVSNHVGVFLVKNKEHFTNEWIQGTPDVVTPMIRDTKSNWDLKTFDDSKLTTLYEWQLKGYCMLLGQKEASLDYCLVNAPDFLIRNERQRMFYAMNCPSDDNDKWIEASRQIERNMIFDVPKFKRDYPNYDLDNVDLNFSMPKSRRIKSFLVEFTENDQSFIKKRIAMSRVYLVAKEIEELKYQ